MIWLLLGFRKSKTELSKYEAILTTKRQDIFKFVAFGHLDFHYKDRTGVNAYPHFEEIDESKRKLYRQKSKYAVKFTARWFEQNYLW